MTDAEIGRKVRKYADEFFHKNLKLHGETLAEYEALSITEKFLLFSLTLDFFADGGIIDKTQGEKQATSCLHIAAIFELVDSGSGTVEDFAEKVVEKKQSLSDFMAKCLSRALMQARKNTLTP